MYNTLEIDFSIFFFYNYIGGSVKNKFVKKILIVFVCLSIFIISIKADSGWDSSYDSGSSWDSGSDWGSSSWDNDYDNDYDYDSSSSSRGSSCNTPECIENTEKILIFFAFLIITLAIFSSVINSVRNTSKRIKRSKMKRKVIRANNIFSPISKEKVDKIIPNFNIEEFNFKAYQIFYDVQIAWMEFDYDKLKELLTDELYNTYVMDLEALKFKNQKNTMKGFELLNCSLTNLKEENGLYIAEVSLNVMFYDYIEDSNTGNILRGTTSRKLNNTYKLTFIKTKEETININNCPMCGAPVEGNSTGICEYCKSKLVNDNYDWVMSKKEKISQR